MITDYKVGDYEVHKGMSPKQQHAVLMEVLKQNAMIVRSVTLMSMYVVHADLPEPTDAE